MTTKTLARAIKRKMPAIIKEKGVPRYVVLDWDMYKKWLNEIEDLEDRVRCEIAAWKSKGKRRYSLKEMKRRYGLK